MARTLGSQARTPPGRDARLRTTGAAAVAVLFVALACAGILGQRAARREAQLDEIELCRDGLQDALDANRSTEAGPSPKRSAAEASSRARQALEWAARLRKRIGELGALRASGTGDEKLELRLDEAALAIADRRFPDALGAIQAAGERAPPGDAGTRDRGAELLRARADAYRDSGDWGNALEQYRQALLRRPELLVVAERAAECQLSLGQREDALRAYSDLASRLQERGSRLLAQLDPRAAVQDLNKAATIRIWLVEQGRSDLTPDLARSFTSCAEALIEQQNLGIAGVYIQHAIEIQSQMLGKEYRQEVAVELAESHALRARALLEEGKHADAIPHLSSAIDLLARLVQEGRLELRRKLAGCFASRGLAHETRSETEVASQDYQKAAETFAALESLGQAVAWQTNAFRTATGDAAREAQVRLDRYRAVTSGPAR